MKLKPTLLLSIFLSLSIPHSVSAEDVEQSLTTNQIETTSKLEALLKKANTGDADALYDIGAMYARGDGVPQDINKAAEWYLKAAEQGNTYAQYMIGHMYAVGDGVAKDDVKAAEWYQKSAEQGNADAQWMLGLMYEEGAGVPMDKVKAVNWFEQSATQGNAGGEYSFGTALWTGVGIRKDENNALEWLHKSAVQGEVYAQTALAVIYTKGDGVAKNSSESFEWSLKAAEQGDALAQVLLATKLLYGNGTTKDEVKAAVWFRKAAIQSNALAQVALGGLYADGVGVSKDYMRAYIWFLLSAAQGNALGAERMNKLETKLTQEQIAEAQRITSKWKEGDTLDGVEFVTASKNAQFQKIFTGTAFLISKDGKAITNDHVTHDCTEIKIAGRDSVAKVVTSDGVNDLALLQIPGKINYVANLNPNVGKLRQGEDVLVFGYPLGTILSSGGNLTPGMVSALSGLGNNTNQIQITAPIQPGSSGSPVIDKNGNVVAVVSMKLNDGAVAHYTGSIPQNVSFAINEQTLKTFLDTNKVQYKMASKSAKEKHNADIADEASKWTVMVECWK